MHLETPKQTKQNIDQIDTLEKVFHNLISSGQQLKSLHDDFILFLSHRNDNLSELNIDTLVSEYISNCQKPELQKLMENEETMHMLVQTTTQQYLIHQYSADSNSEIPNTEKLFKIVFPETFGLLEAGDVQKLEINIVDGMVVFVAPRDVLEILLARKPIKAIGLTEPSKITNNKIPSWYVASTLPYNSVHPTFYANGIIKHEQAHFAARQVGRTVPEIDIETKEQFEISHKQNFAELNETQIGDYFFNTMRMYNQSLTFEEIVCQFALRTQTHQTLNSTHGEVYKSYLMRSYLSASSIEEWIKDIAGTHLSESSQQKLIARCTTVMNNNIETINKIERLLDQLYAQNKEKFQLDDPKIKAAFILGLMSTKKNGEFLSIRQLLQLLETGKV